MSTIHGTAFPEGVPRAVGVANSPWPVMVHLDALAVALSKEQAYALLSKLENALHRLEDPTPPLTDSDIAIIEAEAEVEEDA